MACVLRNPSFTSSSAPAVILLIVVCVFVCIACACFQGEEFAAITPKRLQIPAVSGGSVIKSKIIRDMDKKPNPDVRKLKIKSFLHLRREGGPSEG